MNRKKWTIGILLATAIVLGIALRIAFFGISCRRVPAFDDECKIALQAKQIARGDLPLLILASPYIFPLDAYLQAPIINILPRNAFGARIMAFGFGILALIFSLLILRRWGNGREVWPGLALLLFGSAYLLTLQSACALPGYASLLLISSIVIWMAQQAAGMRRPWIAALIAGIAGGLACSETMLSLPVLLAGGVMLALHKQWRTARWTLPAVAIGALIGLAPHLLAKHLYAGAFTAVQQSIPLPTAIHRLFSPVLDRTLPAALGIGVPIFPDTTERIVSLNESSLCFGVLWLALLSAATLVALVKAFRRWKAECWPSIDSGMAFAGISWMCLGLFLLSARAHSHTYRYFVLAVWSFPFLVAYLYLQAGRTWRVLLGTVALLFVATNLWNTAAIMARWAQPGFATYLGLYDLDPVVRCLDERGINRCYGSYADAYRITYETDERIICCQPYNERFPGYRVPFKEIADAATNVAYVLTEEFRYLKPSVFERHLRTMGVEAEMVNAGDFRVYYNFRAPALDRETRVAPERVRAAAGENREQAPRMMDGNTGAYWRSAKLQHEGLWVEFAFDRPLHLGHVILRYGNYAHDRAPALRIKLRTNAGWETLLDAAPAGLDKFAWMNSHPVYGQAQQTLPIGAAGVHALRLEIAGPNPRMCWTLAEAIFYEVAASETP